MTTAAEVFESAIDWLRENYTRFHFFLERDIVWTIHLALLRRIDEQSLPFRISYNYPLAPGFLADLVIFDEDDAVEIAAEFKYEPSHSRVDIPRAKLPAVFWAGPGSVGKDVERVLQAIADGKTRVAYSVFIDEGGYCRYRDPHPGSVWLDWDCPGNPPRRVSILWSRVATDQ